MEAARWYYLDVDGDNETARGPLLLDQLCELIRSGQLPEDVLVSPQPTLDPSSWTGADAVEEILLTLPLDRERLMREYIGYGEAPRGEENWGWASHRMFSILDALPEFAWRLIVEMIDRAPSDKSLSFLAASPLEDLLSEHGPLFIARVEQRAIESAQFHRALGMLRLLWMTDDVWQRVQTAAKSESGPEQAG